MPKRKYSKRPKVKRSKKGGSKKTKGRGYVGGGRAYK
jgi:hypothetical protein